MSSVGKLVCRRTAGPGDEFGGCLVCGLTRGVVQAGLDEGRLREAEPCLGHDDVADIPAGTRLVCFVENSCPTQGAGPTDDE